MNFSILTPNRGDLRPIKIIILGQVVLFLLFWTFATPVVIPKPMEVISAFPDLWRDGLLGHLYVSIMLYLEALLLATIFSALLALAASLPFFRPAASGWTRLRFLGMTGLTFLFTLYVRGGHDLKLALLTFSISVFMVTGMMDVLDSTPSEKYDLAHTLRMNDWQTLWEVEALGRRDMAFDTLRQNAAIGWMMLGFVEALIKSEGGIGTVLAAQDKQFHLNEVFAIQLTILVIGISQDYMIGVAKNACCPYARLILNRR